MTDTDLDAIRERADKATPGPWIARTDSHVQLKAIFAGNDGSVLGVHMFPEDAEFTINARADVPALLAEVAALRAERELMERCLENCLLLANRERFHQTRRMQSEREVESWGHIQRFCAEAGVKGSILRSEEIAEK